MKEFKTENGTILPLLQLKGKDYLQVAHRVQWFNEKETTFSISTEFLKLDDDQTVCKASVIVISKDGARRSATATKRETKKDFSDHTEKCETSAIGRALALLGYGTQFCTQDFEEGERIADSPVATKVKEVPTQVAAQEALINSAASAPAENLARRSAFKRVTKPAYVAPVTEPSLSPPGDALDG